MIAARPAAKALLLVAIVAGAYSDGAPANAPLTIGGYRVLAADFHVHSALLSDGVLTPWDLVLEAKRQGLDALAITPHGQVFDARLGRWFSRLVGGPTVLIGEEIVTPEYHVIAAGIQNAIGWRRSAARTIEEIHRQGGVAIAAHPGRIFWPGFDAAAMRRLDGAEVCHPMIHVLEDGQLMLEQFLAKAPMAAIGSSDFHGLGRVGMCRTYVFAQDATEEGILDAIRNRRTVVFGRDGRGYGDPELLRLAAADGRLRRNEPLGTERRVSVLLSRSCGLLGLVGMVAFGFWRES